MVQDYGIVLVEFLLAIYLSICQGIPQTWKKRFLVI